MPNLQKLMDDLGEHALVRVLEPIDLARLGYKIRSNTLKDSTEFEELVGDFVQCVYRDIWSGTRMPEFEARSRGKQMLEHAGRRRGQTVMNYLAMCLEGVEGGVRGVLDTITEAIKSEVTEHYLDSVIDEHVRMDSDDDRRAITEAILSQYGHMLPHSIRSKPVEHFVAHYKTLLRELASTIRDNARQFRAV